MVDQESAADQENRQPSVLKNFKVVTILFLSLLALLGCFYGLIFVLTAKDKEPVVFAERRETENNHVEVPVPPPAEMISEAEVLFIAEKLSGTLYIYDLKTSKIKRFKSKILAGHYREFQISPDGKNVAFSFFSFFENEAFSLMAWDRKDQKMNKIEGIDMMSNSFRFLSDSSGIVFIGNSGTVCKKIFEEDASLDFSENDPIKSSKIIGLSNDDKDLYHYVKEYHLFTIGIEIYKNSTLLKEFTLNQPDFLDISMIGDDFFVLNDNKNIISCSEGQQDSSFQIEDCAKIRRVILSVDGKSLYVQCHRRSDENDSNYSLVQVKYEDIEDGIVVKVEKELMSECNGDILVYPSPENIQIDEYEDVPFDGIPLEIAKLSFDESIPSFNDYNSDDNNGFGNGDGDGDDEPDEDNDNGGDNNNVDGNDNNDNGNNDNGDNYNDNNNNGDNDNGNNDSGNNDNDGNNGDKGIICEESDGKIISNLSTTCKEILTEDGKLFYVSKQTNAREYEIRKLIVSSGNDTLLKKLTQFSDMILIKDKLFVSIRSTSDDVIVIDVQESGNTAEPQISEGDDQEYFMYDPSCEEDDSIKCELVLFNPKTKAKLYITGQGPSDPEIGADVRLNANPQVSPDGNVIGFSRGSINEDGDGGVFYSIMLADINDGIGNLRKFDLPDHMNGHHFSFTPDSKGIVCTSKNGKQIYRIDMNGGDDSRTLLFELTFIFPNPDFKEIINPILLKNGALVFVNVYSTRTGFEHTVCMLKDGGKTCETPIRGSVKLIPAGDFVYCFVANSCRPVLVVNTQNRSINLNNFSIKAGLLLFAGGAASEDGKYLYLNVPIKDYARRSGFPGFGLIKVNVEDVTGSNIKIPLAASKIEEVVSIDNFRPNFGLVSPELRNHLHGSGAAGIATDPELPVYDRGQFLFIYDPACAMEFVNLCELVLFNPKTKETVPITGVGTTDPDITKGSRTNDNPQTSPDGKVIGFIRNRSVGDSFECSLMLADRSEGILRTLNLPDWNGKYFSFTPDNSGIVYTANDGKQILSVDLNGENPQTLLKSTSNLPRIDEHVRFPVLLENGALVYSFNFTENDETKENICIKKRVSVVPFCWRTKFEYLVKLIAYGNIVYCVDGNGKVLKLDTNNSNNQYLESYTVSKNSDYIGGTISGDGKILYLIVPNDIENSGAGNHLISVDIESTFNNPATPIPCKETPLRRRKIEHHASE